MRWRPRRQQVEADLNPRERAATSPEKPEAKPQAELPPEVDATATEPTEALRPLEATSWAPIATMVDRGFPAGLVTARTIMEPLPSPLDHHSRGDDAPRGKVRVRAVPENPAAGIGTGPGRAGRSRSSRSRAVVALPPTPRRRRRALPGRATPAPPTGRSGDDPSTRLGWVEASQLDPFFFATLGERRGDPTPRPLEERRAPSRPEASASSFGPLPSPAPSPGTPHSAPHRQVAAASLPPALARSSARGPLAPPPVLEGAARPPTGPQSMVPVPRLASPPEPRRTPDDRAPDEGASPPPSMLEVAPRGPLGRRERPVVRPRPISPPPTGVQPVVARPLGTILPAAKTATRSAAGALRQEPPRAAPSAPPGAPEPPATAASHGASAAAPALSAMPGGTVAPARANHPGQPIGPAEKPPAEPPLEETSPKAQEASVAPPGPSGSPAPGHTAEAPGPRASGVASPPQTRAPVASDLPAHRSPTQGPGTEAPPLSPPRRAGLGAPLAGPVPPSAHPLVGPVPPPKTGVRRPASPASSPAETTTHPTSSTDGPDSRPMVWTPGGFVGPEVHTDVPGAAPPASSRTGSEHPGAPAGGLEAEVTQVEAVTRRVEGWTGVRLPPVSVDRSDSAARRAEELGAAAFTDDAGVHLPSSTGPLVAPEARALLAHELTHVAQRQRLGGAPLPPEDSPIGARLEAEARQAERRERSSSRLVAPESPGARPSPGNPFTVLGHDGGSAGLLVSSLIGERAAPMPPSAEQAPARAVHPDRRAPASGRASLPGDRPVPTPAAAPVVGALMAYPTPPTRQPGRATSPLLPPSRPHRAPASPAQPAWTSPPPPAPPVSPPPPPPPPPSSRGDQPVQRAALAPATASARSPWDEPPSAKQLDQLARRLLPTLTAAIRAELAADRDRIGALTNNYQRW